MAAPETPANVPRRMRYVAIVMCDDVLIDGGAGDDRICGDTATVVSTGPGILTTFGCFDAGGGADDIGGGPGDDQIWGQGGADQICGDGSNAETIANRGIGGSVFRCSADGTIGDDFLFGGLTTAAGPDADVVNGQPGDDELCVGTLDVALGRGGVDTITQLAASATVNCGNHPSDATTMPPTGNPGTGCPVQLAPATCAVPPPLSLGRAAPQVGLSTP